MLLNVGLNKWFEHLKLIRNARQKRLIIVIKRLNWLNCLYSSGVVSVSELPFVSSFGFR